MLGTVALVCSITHDYAFLWRLGLGFAEVPTTLQDHARSLIVWAPAVAVLTVFVAVILGFQTEKTEPAVQVENDDEESGRQPSLVWPLLTLIGMPAIMLLTSRGLDGLIFALPLLSILFALLAHRWKWIRSSWSTAMRSALVVGMVVTSVVFTAGYDQGRKMITSDVEWVIAYSDSMSEDLEQARGIRRFGDATVVVDEKRIVHVVPSSKIVDAYRVEPLTIRERNVCAWFGVFCIL